MRKKGIESQKRNRNRGRVRKVKDEKGENSLRRRGLTAKEEETEQEHQGKEAE